MIYPIIFVNNLSCVREERQLFEDLSFTLATTELVQVEGPNGVGKSTLLAIVAGIGARASGEIHYQGQPIDRVKKHYHEDLLFIGHQSGINTVLTPLENLAFYTKMQPCHDIDHWDVLEKVGLLGFEDVPVDQLSAGQQRRVALTRLWLSKARLWILDEPFTAIDKAGVTLLENKLQQHCQQGGAALITTHQDLNIPVTRRLVLEPVL